jgi:predicted transcriptional regulator
MVTTTIRIPDETWRRLRALAARRQAAEGGRESASAVIAELVNREAAKRTKRGERRADA